MDYLKRKSTKIVFAIALLLLLFFLMTQSDFLVFELPEKADSILLYHMEMQPFEFTLKPYLNKLFKIYDDLNIFRENDNALNSGLPTYAFELSQNDVEFFDAAAQDFISKGYKTELSASRRKTKLEHNGTQFDVTMQLRGHGTGNYMNKRSFNVKIENEDTINGLQSLQFIPPEETGLISHLISNLIAKDLGLKPLWAEFARVTINGRYQGIYLVSEIVDLNYFERNEQPERFPIIVANELMWKDSYKKLGIGLFSAATVHNAPYNYEISMKDVESPFKQEALYAYEQLIRAIENDDYETIEQLTDVEEMGAYEAFRTLRGDIHDSGGDNLRLSYSQTEGKIGFVPRIENGIFPLSEKYDASFEFSLYEKGASTITDGLVKDDIIRNIRNKKLYSIIQRSDELIKMYDDLNTQYRKLLINDISALSSREIRWEIDSSTKNFQNNINIIKGQLEYSRAYIHIFKKDNVIDIEVIPESNSALEFTKFVLNFEQHLPNTDAATIAIVRENGPNETFVTTIENTDLSQYLNRNLLQYGFGSELHAKMRSFMYRITLPADSKVEINDVTVHLKNAVTSRPLADEDIRVGIASGDSFSEEARTKTIYEFLDDNADAGFELQDGALHLQQGTHLFNKNIIVPQGTNVVIEPGATILIAEGTSFLSFSPIFIQGTEENPVIITAQDKQKPFGTFAVVGEGDCRSRITNLDISYGSEDVVEGIYFSGGLAVYYCDLSIQNSEIHDNYADDGANFKHSNVTADSLKVYHNHADQIDLDFCQAEITNSLFRDNGYDTNGDGLDLSGSTATIRRNTFEGFKDKGISIGEQTTILVAENTIKNCTLGSAVKDLSRAIFLYNRIEDTETAISAYMKKPIFGGGYAYLYGNKLQNTNTKYKVDKLSKIYSIKKNDLPPTASLKRVLEIVDNNTLTPLITYDQYSNRFSDYIKLYRYQGQNKLNIIALQNFILSSLDSDMANPVIINSSHNLFQNKTFYDTLNRRLLKNNSAYYLQQTFDDKLQQTGNELHYVFPSDDGTFFYETTEEVSLTKSDKKTIKYILSGNNNPLFNVMEETAGLREKIDAVQQTGYETDEYQIYLQTESDTLLLAELTQKSGKSGSYIEIRIAPPNLATESYQAIASDIQQKLLPELEFTSVNTTEYQTITN